MELIARIEGRDVLVLALGEESLDASNAREFKDGMLAAVQGHRQVVLDLEGVQFVDSSGLGALLACMRHLTGLRGDLRLCNLSAPVQALFELMRMHRIMNVQPTRDDAVRSYALA